MSLAKLSAQRSKDPNTKVGACIVNQNYVVSLGYNGMPKSINCTNANNDLDNDLIFSWEKPAVKEEILNSKYTYVVHAEANAIINANLTNSKIGENAIMYITHMPCFNCAKLIVQSKISRIVYAEDYKNDTEEGKASMLILEKMGVKIEKINQNFDVILRAHK
ncbi:dCMP deaminase family protein [Mycoplasma phocoenae]|uniref:dCMP deaminase family protein n=2 Tax=Mycoplasma phocoenae TaxID=754517 RepID=A0A858U483_9MOLU|nr:dCMP deaminase family protein [Mycoplasma phocoenae]